MKIENNSVVKEVSVPKQSVRFSKEDIEKMIIEKLIHEGIETEGCSVIFNVGFKYVSDEWGMNRHTVVSFTDIVVDNIKTKNLNWEVD